MHFYANNRRVTPQDIYREFEHVSKDVAARIREFLENADKGTDKSAVRQTSWPVSDLCENDQGYILRIELPGVTKESVDITYKEEGKIQVKGIKTINLVEGEKVIRSERKAGEFTRVIDLPNRNAIDENGITASLENGVLEIRIPKNPQANGVTVEIL